MSSLPQVAGHAPSPRSSLTGIALLAARLIVGILMIVVSIDKLQDPVAFLKVVKEYELFPQGWHVLQNSAAIVVPWIELLGGVILVLGLNLQGSAAVTAVSQRVPLFRLSVGLRGTALAILLMLVAFTATVGWRTWQIMQATGTPFTEVEFNCGCGTGSTIIWVKLLENTGLILLTLFIVMSQPAGRPAAAPPMPVESKTHQPPARELIPARGAQ